MSAFAKFLLLVSAFGTYISNASGLSYGQVRNYTEFGCDFQKNYEMSPVRLPTPEWGSYSLRSANFQTKEILFSHLQTIKSNLQTVVEKYNFNNYVVFKLFYKNYLSLHTTINFNRIFDTYRPLYRAGETDDSQSVEVLSLIKKKLKSTLPHIDDSIFLCASIANPSEELVQSFNQPGRSGESQNYFNHAIGAIKFSIRSNKERIGYILLQPGYGFSNPILVMEDGQPPHGAFGPYGDTDLQYSVLPKNKKFIVARSANNICAFLIYVGRPFCTFLDTSSHYEILSKYKKVIKRDAQGATQGGFYFSIEPTNRQLTLVLHNAEYPISFEKGEVNDLEIYHPIINEKEEEVLTEIGNLLDYKTTLLKKEFSFIGQILHDGEFLVELNQAGSSRSSTRREDKPRSFSPSSNRSVKSVEGKSRIGKWLGRRQ